MVEDARDGLHAGVIGARVRRLVPRAARARLVPVVNAAHKRRDEPHLRLPAGHGLAQGKQQREVAVDAAPLQPLCGADAFPRGGNLDEHALHRHALGLIQLDQALGAGVSGVFVKRQARVHFSGNAPRNQRQDFAAKAHQQPVGHFVQRPAAMRCHGLRQQRRVFGLLHGLENERRVGGGVLRLKLRQLAKVARVGHHGSELPERVELIHDGRGLSALPAWAWR